MVHIQGSLHVAGVYLLVGAMSIVLRVNNASLDRHIDQDFLVVKSLGVLYGI